MKAIFGDIRLSASDLSNHLACHHLTSLDLAVSLGARPAPAWDSPDAKVLRERGMAHENAYLAHLAAQGVSIVNLRDVEDSGKALTETRAAMESGAEAIAQATLVHGRWFGRSEGSSEWRTFRSITLPLLRPVLVFVLVTICLSAAWSSLAIFLHQLVVLLRTDHARAPLPAKRKLRRGY
jgi:hypothetical protein